MCDAERFPDVTHVTPRVSSAVQLGQVHGIGSGSARAAPERVLHDERASGFLAAEELQDEGLCLGVVLADPAPTESTRPNRVPATVPAVHEPSSVLPHQVGSGAERTASERIRDDELESVSVEREQPHR